MKHNLLRAGRMRLGWPGRIILALGCLALILAGVALVASTPPLTAQPVSAQGGGQDPTDKPTSIDFYPDPLSEGALAYSLRDPWDHTDLTYFFHNCPSRLDCVEAREAVRTGFIAWADISALTFTEVDDVSQADIEVSWIDGSNDPEEVLGTPGDVLAYAYFPRFGGDMFIDDVEPWTIGDGGEFDLELTATHEIGHAIGLGHSEFTNAIMYPYSGYAVELGQDDLAAIQALYGPPSGTTPPPSNDQPETPTDPDVRTIPADQATVTVEGSISDATSYEVWDLTVEAGDTVTVRMDVIPGQDLDAYVAILTSDLATVLAENDDLSNDNRNARVSHTFEEGGQYVVIATRFGFEDGTTTGNYILTVQYDRAGGPGGGPDTVDEPETGTVTWRVTNFAGTELCYIYFSDSSSDTWGPDQLGAEQVLNSNFYLEWEVPRSAYDIQVWDCFGNKLERYNVPAQRDIDVQIFQDSIEVVTLNRDDDVGAGDDDRSVNVTETAVLRVGNYAGVELCAIYISPTANDRWGPNWLENNTVLAGGMYLEWTLDWDRYDLRVEDCSGNFLEQHQIVLRRNIEAQVYQTRILPVPLN